MKRKQIDCNSAREICLISLLNNQGYRPTRENSKDAWFSSPFRKETAPSFKISKRLNRWYDHGEGIGGNTLDFIIHLKNCSVKEALIYLSDNSFSFHQQKSYSEPSDPAFEIIKKQNLQNNALIDYLKSRRISIDIAKVYCFEIYYKMKNKRYFSIAFQNDSGGFELRNKYFKGCCGTKDITTLKNASKTVNLFEGFTDFLSYLSLKPHKANEDFIIANSTSMVKNIIEVLPKYQIVKSFFDNDNSGRKATEWIQQNCKNEFENWSLKFKEYKDFNDYLIYIKDNKKTQKSIKRGQRPHKFSI